MTAFEKSSITAEAAQRLIDAGEAEASARDLALVFAVCDESGVLKAFRRMDGAALMSVQIAQDKAYTAAGFGLATNAWHELIEGDSQIGHGAGGIDRLVAFAGGVPITVDERLVGGFGVSGAHYSQDLEVAQAALATVLPASTATA
jgi:uncharacterized protein GlcG (DUF336 family)